MKILIPLSFTFMILTLISLNYSLLLSIKIPISSLLSSSIDISILLDWVSLMFMSIIMLISSMILLFSYNYIPKKEHKLFSLLLIMFVSSMLILILSNNLILVILGWDGLGLSSYILVIYYQNPSSSASGLITILSNRIGDIMILMAMAIMFLTSNWNLYMNMEFPTIVMFLLLTAALTKSAQFPFSAWLPAAMAAPTPISALVHSSTLVTAGVYIMMRLMTHPHPNTMLILMIISSITSIYSSLNANWEQDMKKIIALSTLSQIALMMFAISLNSLNLAFFHLIIHALFKSTMFLCAGMLIHSSSFQDMRFMSMVQYNPPLMLSIMGVSNMALMGIPFMSGFFSKDTIMETMISSKTNMTLTLLMISSIGATSTYSIRMMFKTLTLEIKTPSTIHHNEKAMSSSILIMSSMSIFMGATLLWMINPAQTIILPLSMKISILTSMTLGILMSLSLNFNNKSFLTMGSTAISMWFIHTLSSNFFQSTQNIMKTFPKNDNSWKEMYGPQGMFNSLTTSPQPDFTNSTIMLISIMIIIIPMIMM